jgi:hypothetical protein
MKCAVFAENLNKHAEAAFAQVASNIFMHLQSYEILSESISICEKHPLHICLLQQVHIHCCSCRHNFIPASRQMPARVGPSTCSSCGAAACCCSCAAALHACCGMQLRPQQQQQALAVLQQLLGWLLRVA